MPENPDARTQPPDAETEPPVTATDGSNARSQPLAPDQARDLVLGLERHGIETDNITVETETPLQVSEVSAVDNATIRRPVRRAVIGAAVGVAVALALGFAALAVWDDMTPAPVVLMAVLIGALLGALWSLYGGLEASTEVRDIDSGGPTVVETSVVDLDAAKAQQARRLTDEA